MTEHCLYLNSDNPFTNVSPESFFPDSDIYTKNNFSFSFDPLPKGQGLSGLNEKESLEDYPVDSDEDITDFSMRASSSSLAEDWGSKEDRIWDSI